MNNLQYGEIRSEIVALLQAAPTGAASIYTSIVLDELRHRC